MSREYWKRSEEFIRRYAFNSPMSFDEFLNIYQPLSKETAEKKLQDFREAEVRVSAVYEEYLKNV